MNLDFWNPCKKLEAAVCFCNCWAGVSQIPEDHWPASLDELETFCEMKNKGGKLFRKDS